MFIELGTHIGMGMMISSRWGQWHPEWGKLQGLAGSELELQQPHEET